MAWNVCTIIVLLAIRWRGRSSVAALCGAFRWCLLVCPVAVVGGTATTLLSSASGGIVSATSITTSIGIHVAACRCNPCSLLFLCLCCSSSSGGGCFRGCTLLNGLDSLALRDGVGVSTAWKRGRHGVGAGVEARRRLHQLVVHQHLPIPVGAVELHRHARVVVAWLNPHHLGALMQRRHGCATGGVASRCFIAHLLLRELATPAPAFPLAAVRPSVMTRTQLPAANPPPAGAVMGFVVEGGSRRGGVIVVVVVVVAVVAVVVAVAVVRSAPGIRPRAACVVPAWQRRQVLRALLRSCGGHGAQAEVPDTDGKLRVNEPTLRTPSHGSRAAQPDARWRLATLSLTSARTRAQKRRAGHVAAGCSNVGKVNASQRVNAHDQPDGSNS